jgi:ubiquinone/menaquinone biosynthesis C-methylase UbiE
MLTSVQDAYEALYTGKSYQHEIGLVDVVLDKKLGPAGPAKKKPPRKVLEVGCGPGLRLAVLKQWQGKYDAEGLDYNSSILNLARKRVSGMPLHCADMREINLDTRYDSIMALFGVIGYMPDYDNMVLALRSMREHLVPHGVLLLEPWLTPENATNHYLRADSAKRPGVEVSRMNFTRIVENKTILSVHYLIGDRFGVRHVQEIRQLTLFNDDQYRSALKEAGFGEVMLEAYGPQGRGMYVAQI